MNPKNNKITAAGHRNGLSAPSHGTQPTRTSPASTEVNQHPLPIPSIVVTPFVNQLPSQAELLGYNLKNTQADSSMKHKPRNPQTARSARGMNLLPPGMSYSNTGPPGTRQLPGGNSVIGPPESPWLIEFGDQASNNTSQGGSMSAAYGQGQINQHSYMTSVSNLRRRASSRHLKHDRVY